MIFSWFYGDHKYIANLPQCPKKIQRNLASIEILTLTHSMQYNDRNTSTFVQLQTDWSQDQVPYMWDLILAPACLLLEHFFSENIAKNQHQSHNFFILLFCLFVYVCSKACFKWCCCFLTIKSAYIAKHHWHWLFEFSVRVSRP